MDGAQLAPDTTHGEFHKTIGKAGLHRTRRVTRHNASQTIRPGPASFSSLLGSPGQVWSHSGYPGLKTNNANPNQK